MAVSMWLTSWAVPTSWQHLGDEYGTVWPVNADQRPARSGDCLLVSPFAMYAMCVLLHAALGSCDLQKIMDHVIHRVSIISVVLMLVNTIIAIS